MRPLTVAAAPGTSVVAVKTMQPNLILTFDDGPEPGGTDAVLGALGQADASATFFVLVSRARRNSSLMRELIDSGQEVGLHGIEHERLTSLSNDRLMSELRDGRQELEELVGRKVTWFRPPFGAQNAKTWRAIVGVGMVPVFWGPQCKDWLSLATDDYLAEVRARGRAGEIVLMHDGYAGTGDPPSHDRGDLTRRVLEIAGARGLVGSSLAETLSAPDSELIFEPVLDRNSVTFSSDAGGSPQ